MNPSHDCGTFCWSPCHVRTSSSPGLCSFGGMSALLCMYYVQYWSLDLRDFYWTCGPAYCLDYCYETPSFYGSLALWSFCGSCFLHVWRSPCFCSD
ncbi:hypothetical protein GDO81_017424 [Engystomops pustulosus]|uniref:Uncharacterized protein n=1 Tax=Engystomops pustulosus TaxID=76066 RepID=A0AAV7AIB0_ENGPU|nr:hypothetical protein GDO81_017424 [Engystomops pustulosus]